MSFGFTTLAEDLPCPTAGASSLWDLDTVTYEELRRNMAERVLGSQPDDAARRRQANLNSALNQFMRVCQIEPGSRVGYHLGERFPEHLRRFSEALAREGASPTRIRDCRSLLKRWFDLATSLREEARGGHLSFRNALSEALAASPLTLKEVARRIGVTTGTLRAWRRGVLPNSRSIPTLRRLELTLGFERDSLLRLIPTREVRRAICDAPTSQYRVRLRERAQDRYFMPLEDADARFREEWTAFLRYKTEMHTTLERQVRGVWRTRPADTVSRDKRKWYCMTESGRVAPTAIISFQRLRALIGYARRAAQSGTLSPNTAAPASLALFASPEIVLGYVNFLFERSGQKRHGGLTATVSLASSLVHPRTGYLSQNEQFAELLRVPVNQWKAHCEMAFLRFRTVEKSMSMNPEKSRDPWEPIRNLVASAVPIQPVLDGIARARRDLAALPAGSQAHALAVRDLLLISFMVSNPLRAQNFRAMTYRPDNTGNLYKAPDGSWRLQLPPEAFKNVAGAAKHRHYDTAVDPALTDLLEQWLFEEKPILDPDNGPLVFVSAANPREPWGRLDRAVRLFSQRYVEGSMGWGPHSLRHLVATTFLKKAPGQYQQVAMLLHDQLKTVLKHYAHLSPEDGLSSWRSLLGDIARGGK